ncbi:MAG: cupin domain-containing protein [Vicinamibacterales bacterium]
MSALTASVILSAGGFVASLRAQHAHVMQGVAEAQWGPAPPVLPPGAEIAILSGDPTKPGPYSVRLRFPANYVIPAHSHPTDENVIVLSGAVTFGMGDRVTKGDAGNKTLAPGGYFLASAGMNHFAYTTRQSSIVLYGQGPVEFNYVNPADDPRKAMTGSR